MRLAARLGTLACGLALIACGGTSHTRDGGPHDVDGATHDAAADEDAATSNDGGVVEGTCTGEAVWPSGRFGTGELVGLGAGPWTATVTAVDATGVDLEVEGVARRFVWPGSDLGWLSPGMEVELSQRLRWSTLVAPGVTFHAAYAAHIGAEPELFRAPIVVEGAPPSMLRPDCTFAYDACSGPDLATRFALEVGGAHLRAGESTSGAGYAIYFGGAASYPGNHGAGTGGCIEEASHYASLGVRVDHPVAPETCASIEARYEQVLEEKASCEQPTDCRITSGHCGVGLGGCWYAVSGDVSELDALAERYRDLGCTSAVCRCLPPPESASCVAGRCMAD